MHSGLIVDEENRLKEARSPRNSENPPATRIIATILSYLFHPVFVPLYVVAFMLYVHPYLFAGVTAWNKTVVLLQAILMFTFFPLVTVLLLRALKFIESVQLSTQKDRIIPIVACMIWYFWIWYVWHNLPGYPKEAAQFAMAIFLSSIVALMINNYMKISLHTIAMGVALAFIIYLGLTQSVSFGLYISLALLATGLVCTARFLASDHRSHEIYGGLFLGILAQVVATYLF